MSLENQHSRIYKKFLFLLTLVMKQCMVFSNLLIFEFLLRTQNLLLLKHSNLITSDPDNKMSHMPFMMASTAELSIFFVVLGGATQAGDRHA